MRSKTRAMVGRPANWAILLIAVFFQAEAWGQRLTGRNSCESFRDADNPGQYRSASRWEFRRGIHRRYRDPEAMKRLARVRPLRLNLRNQFAYDRSDFCVWSDMSAVLDETPDALMRAATDYNNYVRMEMPHVRRSEIVRQSTDRWLIFNVMSLAGFTSRHFLEARRRDENENSQLLGWRLVRRGGDSPSFHGLVGSFYIEPVEIDGQTKSYVRYFLKAKLNNGLLGIFPGVVERIMRDEFGGGVKRVIHNISQHAR